MVRRGRRPAGSVAVVAVTAVIAAIVASCGSGGAAAPTTTFPNTTVTTTTTTTTTVPVPPPPKQLTPADLLAASRHSVVRVRNTGCGELSTGSAWLADDGAMVSNRHVVEGLRNLEMNTWDGRDLVPAGAEIADEADISRIRGTWPVEARLTPLPIRTTRVEPGERIAIIGYPEGNELDVATGVALGYATDPELAPREILKLTTVVRPGNSGGPAVDAQGRVVGVVYAKERANDASLVIPIADVFGETAALLRPETGCA